MTVLYYTFFEEKIPNDIFAKKLNILPRILREKTEKFRRWQDAYASLFGKLLLLQGLKDFGISADISNLHFTKYGKPYLPGSSVCFNISHSGCCAVCILSDEVDTIGIDVEEIKTIDIYDFSNVWTAFEWDEIIKGSLEVFYDYWTRKEAVLKADGQGIATTLKKIDARGLQIAFNDKMYFLKSFNIHVNYKLHLAALRDFNNDIQIVMIDQHLFSR